MKEQGKKIDELSNQLVDLRVEMWQEHTLYTWQWWMLLLVCIGMVVIFIVAIDRTRILQIFSYLGIIYILNKNLDDVATALDFYDYRMQLEPIIPTMLPANLFAIPIWLTLLYQWFSRWKTFALALILFSVALSYGALPLMKMAGIYLEKTWNSQFSFVSLLIMGSLAKWFVDYLVGIQVKK